MLNVYSIIKPLQLHLLISSLHSRFHTTPYQPTTSPQIQTTKLATDCKKRKKQEKCTLINNNRCTLDAALQPQSVCMHRCVLKVCMCIQKVYPNP